MHWEPIYDRKTITDRLKSKARRLGFQSAGVCPAVTPSGIHRFLEWLSRGYAGEMAYLTNRTTAYHHPNSVLDGTRSLLMLAMAYSPREPKPPVFGEGRVSRYAYGALDYHDLIHSRLKQLKSTVQSLIPGCRARGVVDTAPLLEREFARLAGLGWIGKNTLLINPKAGSYFFLAALLVDQELDYDPANDHDYCGTCRACLDACPTQAFPEPYVLDARRCISYLNIELRESVPRGLRSEVGDWLFGCDVCQEVCPWNRRAPDTQEPEFEAVDALNPADLSGLFGMDDGVFRRRFRGTPFWRARRRGILRNAALVLGNQRATKSIPTLGHGLHDDEPVVRAACAWALGRFRDALARTLLESRRDIESDDEVSAEIQLALKNIENV